MVLCVGEVRMKCGHGQSGMVSKHVTSCLAYEADVDRKNKVVQLSVQAGLSGCRVFHKRTPRYIRLYIIDVGNETNHESSSTTFLQVCAYNVHIMISMFHGMHLVCIMSWVIWQRYMWHCLALLHNTGTPIITPASVYLMIIHSGQLVWV